MDIEMTDLVSVCRILDAVIKRRIAEENEHLDRTTNQPMIQLEAGFHAYGLESLEELRDLRDRLFCRFPREML